MWAMNVIVLVCNSLHLGFLGTYGNPWIETPNLDRLAAEGIVFDHHFPENLTTLPTRRSWWTGRYGFADEAQGWTPLRAEERILPDLLWDKGVSTALISDVPLLREAGLGYGRGFDEVIWVRGQGYDPLVPPGDPRARAARLADEPGLRLPDEEDPGRALWRTRWEQLLRNRAVLRTDREENTGVARTVKTAIEWLEGRAKSSSPFLLWLDLFSPHGPWDLPLAFRDRYVTVEPDEFEAGEEGDLVEESSDLDDDEIEIEDVVALIDVPAGAVGDVLSEAELFRLRRTYAGSVTLADRWLGQLFEAMRRLGRADDTLLIFTSDQGEPLGEHGYVRRFRPWLYEELIHTPLIVRMPRAEYGGIRHQAIVQTVDLLPTVISALGLPPIEGDDAPDGHDLIPLIRGERSKVRDYACLGMDVAEFAIRTHLWHLIVPIETDPDEPRSPELFRKPEDRWDQNNVIAQHPEVAEHLELALRRFVAALRRGSLDDLPVLRDVARFGAG
jgi:arylsulfatase A-like enzyme